MRVLLFLLLSGLASACYGRTFAVSGNDSTHRFFFDASAGIGWMNNRYTVPALNFNTGYKFLCLSMRMTRSAKQSPDRYIFENAWLAGCRLYFPKGWTSTFSTGYSDIAFEKGSHVFDNYDPVRFEKFGSWTSSIDIQFPTRVNRKPYPINWDLQYYTTFNKENNLNGFSLGLNFTLDNKRNSEVPFVHKTKRGRIKDTPPLQVKENSISTDSVAETIRNYTGISVAEFFPELDLFWVHLKNENQGMTFMAGYRLPAAVKRYDYLFENPDFNMQAVTASVSFDHYYERKHKDHYKRKNVSLVTGFRYCFLHDWVYSYDHYSVDQAWLIDRKREDLSILLRWGRRTAFDSYFFAAIYVDAGVRLSLYQTHFDDIRYHWQTDPKPDAGFQWIENGFSGGFEFHVRLMLGGAMQK